MLSVEVLVVCAMNPFTALLLVPAAHLCLLAALPRAPRRPLLAPAILVGGRSRCPSLALLYYGARFDLGLSLDSYALMLADARQRLARERGARVAGGRQPGVEPRCVALARGRPPRPPCRSRCAAR